MFGVAGKEARQDCFVKVNIKDSGGLNITVNSKLSKLFGRHMKIAAEEAAEEMGIENAEIEINDFSSLDFTIKARTKTAIRRALNGKSE